MNEIVGYASFKSPCRSWEEATYEDRLRKLKNLSRLVVHAEGKGAPAAGWIRSRRDFLKHKYLDGTS